jgi:hypothetical protein
MLPKCEVYLHALYCTGSRVPLRIEWVVSLLSELACRVASEERKEPLLALSPHQSRVPHISLVFREMWDTAGLPLKPVDPTLCSLGDLGFCSQVALAGRPFPKEQVRVVVGSCGARAVESHISRKTSEMWGTRLWSGG